MYRAIILYVMYVCIGISYFCKGYFECHVKNPYFVGIVPEFYHVYVLINSVCSIRTSYSTSRVHEFEGIFLVK